MVEWTCVARENVKDNTVGSTTRKKRRRRVVGLAVLLNAIVLTGSQSYIFVEWKVTGYLANLNRPFSFYLVGLNPPTTQKLTLPE